MLFRRSVANTPDGDLVSRSARGDESAFKELLDRHQGAVYGFARRFLKDAQEAEEIAQEVFLRLYRTAGTYRCQASLRSYLFRIAKNLCIDVLRKKRPEPMAEPPETTDGRTAFEQVAEAQSLQRLLEALDRLPDNQRAAILLRHDQGMRYEEIAESLNLTVSAVDSLLVRARRTLRKRLPDLC
jgi:RNA polymerase sigma-70 factor (ECF subfamily)